MRCLWLLSLCVFQLEALHSSVRLSVHDQSKADLDHYEGSLMEILSNAQTSLGNIAKIGSRTLENSKTVGEVDPLGKAILQGGLRDQRLQLIQIISTTVVPLWAVNWQCNEVSRQDQAAFNISVNNMRSALEGISGQLASAGTCQRDQALLEDLLVMRINLINMAKQRIRYCTNTNITNPNANETNATKTNTTIPKPIPPPPNFVGKPPATPEKECPQQLPFLSKSTCMQCKLPAYFNYTKQACMSCQKGQIFDVVPHKCVSPHSSSYPQFNSKLGSSDTLNYINTPPVLNSDFPSCSLEQPYFNGINCTDCSPPKFFDFETLTCEQCPTSFAFNTKTKGCDPDYTNFCFSNSLSKAKNYISKVSMKGPCSNHPLASCPDRIPFFNGKICSACHLPAFYNFTSNDCQFCADTKLFDTDTQKCVQLPASDRKNSNIMGASNFVSLIPSFDSSLGTCPQEKPYFSKIICIACPLPKFFDFQTSECKSCDNNKLAFSLSSRSCEYIDQSFVTDLSNKNIFYLDDFNTFSSAARMKMSASNGKITFCSPETPFYDATTNLCVSCPPNIPLYNMKYNQCMKCSDGMVFNADTHLCLNSLVIQPTMERMLMNSFNFGF